MSKDEVCVVPLALVVLTIRGSMDVPLSYVGVLYYW